MAAVARKTSLQLNALKYSVVVLFLISDSRPEPFSPNSSFPLCCAKSNFNAKFAFDMVQ